MNKLKSYAKVASIVGVKATAVGMFVRRYMRDGKLERKRVKVGHHKVPPLLV